MTSHGDKGIDSDASITDPGHSAVVMPAGIPTMLPANMGWGAGGCPALLQAVLSILPAEVT